MNDLQEIAEELQEAEKPHRRMGRPPKKSLLQSNHESSDDELVESSDEPGVLVRFNCRTSVHMIPDSEYHDEVKTLKEMRYKDYKSYVQRLAAGSPYETKNFTIGDVALVPEWYYKSHKNDIVKISVSIDKFKNKAGQIRPFNGDEAVMHGYIKEPTDTMQKVKRFEKVENDVN